MYARITTYQADPAKLDDMVSKLEEPKAQINTISGLVDVYSVWRSDGQGVTVAIYEDQEAAEAATSQVQAIWGGMMEYLTAAPQAETYDGVEHMTG